MRISIHIFKDFKIVIKIYKNIYFKTKLRDSSKKVLKVHAESPQKLQKKNIHAKGPKNIYKNLGKESCEIFIINPHWCPLWESLENDFKNPLENV